MLLRPGSARRTPHGDTAYELEKRGAHLCHRGIELLLLGLRDGVIIRGTIAIAAITGTSVIRVIRPSMAKR